MILQPVSSGTGGGTANIREGVFLEGSYDGHNQIFNMPEPAIHIPPLRTVKVYHGGRRLQAMEYELMETVPGTGYDKVRIIFAPQQTSRLYVDYWVAA